MKHLRWLTLILAAVLVAGTLRAAEVGDLTRTDASNTGTAANAGFPEGMPPSDVNNAARALEGMIARWYRDWRGAIVAYQTADAIRITPFRTISALTDGLTFMFEATAANTGATTLQVGTLDAVTIRKTHDVDLVSGDIESGQKVLVTYNADEDIFQMLSQTASSSGFSDPMSTRGDIIFRNSGNTTTRLAVGATNTILRSVSGTDISWGGLVIGMIANATDGELISWNSSAVATTVTAGIVDHILTSQGAGSVPRFQPNPARMVQIASQVTSGFLTGSTTVPDDDSIPQNTEGDEYMSLAFTPLATANTLIIDVVLYMASSNNATQHFVAALFQDSTADALAAGREISDGSAAILGIVFSHTMTAGTTSSTTFKVRAGNNQTGTTTFNGVSGARKLGGVLASSIIIREYLP